MRRSNTVGAKHFSRSRSGGASWLRVPLLLLGLYFASYADLYIQSVTNFKPLYIQLLFFAIFGFYLLSCLGTRSPWVTQNYHVWLALAVYAFWSVVTFAYAPYGIAPVDEFVERLKAVAFIAAFMLVLSDQGSIRTFGIGCAVLVFISTILCLYDFLQPTFTTVPGRGAGLYQNPTIAALMIPALALISMPFISRPMRYVIWTLAVIGVLATFSRQGWIFIAVTTVALVFSGYFYRGRTTTAFVFAILVILLLFLSLDLKGALFWVTESTPLGGFLTADTLARLGFGGVAGLDASAVERAYVVDLANSYFGTSPIWGHGLGFTRTWEANVGTHNMYLLFLAEGGLIALVSYIMLFAALLVRRRQNWLRCDSYLLLVVLLLFAGFFSHNLLNASGEAVVFGVLGSSMLLFQRSADPVLRRRGRGGLAAPYEFGGRRGSVRKRLRSSP